MKWIEHHRPSWVVVENVVEFEQWGPVSDKGIPLVSKRGAFFHAWIAAIEAAGYVVEWRHLNAADFGAATSRNRLFVVARKGRRSPVFPEPTHQRNRGRTLPGMERPAWRTAAEVIDWTLPCLSIFGRKRPLADKTIAKIEAGRILYGQRFLVSYYGNGGPSSVDAPLPTITTRDRFGLVDGDRFRMITRAEMQILQGFPAEYRICGSRADQVKQIGNSVSPPVAAAITRAIAGAA